MKRIANLILGRCTIIALLMLLQVSWLVVVLYQFSYQFTYMNYIVRGVAIVVSLLIANKWNDPGMKLSWIFFILLSPILGLLLYLIFGRPGLTKSARLRMDVVNCEVEKHIYQTPDAVQWLEQHDKAAYRQSKYVNDWAGFPLYQNTSTKYYKSGEDMFVDMLAALEAAEHFIFLEYFIVEPGHMLNQMVDILERKAKEGVDVRLIYDDVGSISTMPPKYYKVLEAKGIKCAAFNQFRPILSVLMNNRDHRKIFVVDGKIGFTGGINLADEYINEVERFGYWKDTGVRLIGEGVWSLTVMFLEMWDYMKHMKEDYKQYMPQVYQTEPFISDGLVQPYGDTPLDGEKVGENIYLNMISHAENYVYIFTPYLIVDSAMLACLRNAAKKGVDVRIVTPGIPDKKMVFMLTQAHYEPLLACGVKIYQYRPGFIHAKSFVCDDKIATIGSVNLDYRSLYLHFECGVLLYGSRAVMELKQDCQEVFACSDEITMEFCKKRGVLVRTFQGVLRLFAPLM